MRRRVQHIYSFIIVLFSLFLVHGAVAQNDSIDAGPVEKRENKVYKIPETREHNPNKALILSAVLPGAGQVYNKQAWKIPIIYGALGGVGYYTYINHTQMKRYKDEYLFRVNNDGAGLYSDLANDPTSNIYNMYESYNQTFQLSVIIGVAIYGLNLLDAYIFGHLFDFQISDDLTLNIIPYPFIVDKSIGNGIIPGATVSINF